MNEEKQNLITAWLKFLSYYQCIPEGAQDYLSDVIKDLNIEIHKITNFYWHCSKCGNEWPKYSFDEVKPKCPKCQRCSL